MRLRRWLWATPVAIAVAAGIGAESLFSANNKDIDDPTPSVSLPVTQVVMFNSGVGYFARSGDIENNARVDLTFQETDINDLLKSMTLQDFDGGRVAAVSYESREPVTRTLESFAINLNNKPTLGDILTQTRGEKVEVVMQPTATNQPGTITGTVVGMEMQKLPVGTAQVDTQMLNLHTSEGFRCVKMSEVQRVRFLNPVLEAELRRALDVLALSHDTQKKAVQLSFQGDGRRRVKVGYVVEAPIWKTSYRLMLDKDNNPKLQGWAIVENPTDEDWNGVKMALVSGRPLSFQMDLYNPRYIPRPTVELDLMASIRPPAYEGGIRREADGLAMDNRRGAMPAPSAPSAGFDSPAGFGGGGAPLAKNARRKDQEKAFADQFGRELSESMDMGAVSAAASAEKLGNYFQYIIEHPVSLARQKSSMLPVVTKDIEGSRVSIYNQNVQTKHPLHGIRFKNTTGMQLNQGPITVFDGSTYAGDARLTDVQANDERLIAYAVDLGTEVIPQNGAGSTRITNVKATRGIVTITRRLREEKVYKISNKSDSDRTLLIEHANRTNQQFKLVDTEKPVEETAALFRFETKVAAGKTEEFKVKEERDLGEQISLTNSNDNTIQYLFNLNEASPALKAKLKESLTIKAKWDDARQEMQQIQADIARITKDQERIRRNLKETPPQAEVYKEYLKKLSAQEKEMDDLTEKQKSMMENEYKTRRTYEEFLINITE